MRTFDVSPFYRSSVGFDRMLDLLASPAGQPLQDEGPAYDIERLGEDRYRIVMALAGFEPQNLAVIAEANALLVEGRPAEDVADRTFVHRGIVQRPFRRQFDLADFIKVTGAAFEHGLLSIELEREIPEAMKPRRIRILNGEGQARVESLETVA